MCHGQLSLPWKEVRPVVNRSSKAAHVGPQACSTMSTLNELMVLCSLNLWFHRYFLDPVFLGPEILPKSDRVWDVRRQSWILLTLACCGIWRSSIKRNFRVWKSTLDTSIWELDCHWPPKLGPMKVRRELVNLLMTSSEAQHVWNMFRIFREIHRRDLCEKINAGWNREWWVGMGWFTEGWLFW